SNHADAGVVHQPGQSCITNFVGDGFERRSYLIRICNIKLDGGELGGGLSLERFAMAALAHAGEDTEVQFIEGKGAGSADPGGCTGNNDAAYGGCFGWVHSRFKSLLAAAQG